MSWRALFWASTVFLGTVSLAVGKDRWQVPASLDRIELLAAFSRGARNVNAGARKTCSEVYPMPEAAKHWTDCKSGQFSQCGGPDDCTCNDADDRLVWYECKEGSYARCEDDHTCVDSCRY